MILHPKLVTIDDVTIIPVPGEDHAVVVSHAVQQTFRSALSESTNRAPAPTQKRTRARMHGGIPDTRN